MEKIISQRIFDYQSLRELGGEWPTPDPELLRDLDDSSDPPPLKPIHLMALKRLSDTEDLPEGDFIVEWKYDGFLTQSFQEGDKLKILSRRGTENYTDKFPDIKDAIRKLLKDGDFVIGELVWLVDSKQDVSKVESIAGSKVDKALTKYKEYKGRPVLYVFDVLWRKGKKVSDKPLRERKRILDEMFRGFTSRFVKKVKSYKEDEAQNALKDALKAGCEGIVFKNLDKEYVIGPRKEVRPAGVWYKYKVGKESTDDYVVYDYTKGREGSLILICGQYDKGKLVEMARVDNLSKEREKKFKKLLDAGKKFVIELGFQEKTAKGRPRHVRFVRERPDKPMKSVTVPREFKKARLSSRHLFKGSDRKELLFRQFKKPDYGFAETKHVTAIEPLKGVKEDPGIIGLESLTEVTVPKGSRGEVLEEAIYGAGKKFPGAYWRVNFDTVGQVWVRADEPKIKKEASVKVAAEPKHPEKVIIDTNFVKLTEQQIYNYNNSIKDKLLKQFEGRDAFIILKTNGQIIKRDLDGKRITKENFDKINGGRTAEWHLVANPRDLIGWVDIDPKDRVPFSKTKAVTRDVYNLLRRQPEVKNVNLKFSGGRGFHCVITLKGEKRDVSKTREWLKGLLNDYIEKKGDKKLTTGVTRDPSAIRLDTSTLHKGGSIRAAYSLNAKTGLISKPLSVGALKTFEKKQAKPKVAKARISKRHIIGQLVENKKVLLVVSPVEYQDTEYNTPKKIFLANGITVETASSSNTASSMAGIKILVDKLLEDVNVADYDAIVFVGGKGAIDFSKNPLAQELAKEAHKQNKVLAAICHGPLVLAKAGLLKGVEATSWAESAGELKEAGAKYEDVPVKKDELIITGRDPEAAEEFAKTILEEISKKVESAVKYKKGDKFYFVEPDKAFEVISEQEAQGDTPLEELVPDVWYVDDVEEESGMLNISSGERGQYCSWIDPRETKIRLIERPKISQRVGKEIPKIGQIMIPPFKVEMFESLSEEADKNKLIKYINRLRHAIEEYEPTTTPISVERELEAVEPHVEYEELQEWLRDAENYYEKRFGKFPVLSFKKISQRAEKKLILTPAVYNKDDLSGDFQIEGKGPYGTIKEFRESFPDYILEVRLRSGAVKLLPPKEIAVVRRFKTPEERFTEGLKEEWHYDPATMAGVPSEIGRYYSMSQVPYEKVMRYLKEELDKHEEKLKAAEQHDPKEWNPYMGEPYESSIAYFRGTRDAVKKVYDKYSKIKPEEYRATVLEEEAKRHEELEHPTAILSTVYEIESRYKEGEKWEDLRKEYEAIYRPIGKSWDRILEELRTRGWIKELKKESRLRIISKRDKLKRYREKRDFEGPDKTTEPKGEVKKTDKNRYVIHLHKTLRKPGKPHLDLRLEKEGVLESWAIPKGKLPTGKERLLAVKVEPHPISYLKFKGKIPEGQYGAGDVSIKESGTYEILEEKRNKIKVKIKSGVYNLVRAKGNRWLIMKGTKEAKIISSRVITAAKPFEELYDNFVMLTEAGLDVESERRALADLLSEVETSIRSALSGHERQRLEELSSTIKSRM